MSSFHDLASRVQALEDIEAIKRLKARWWFACDTRDLAGMRACYDEDDFLIDFGFIGEFTDMDAFIEVFESLACHPTHVDMHHGTAPEIEMTGPDSATGRWRMRFQLLETE
ncbi:MAG: nuclear transport factor 2 family protein, partial [Pseudomonadota bacterium]|nr:nuclear transport factor 2 family protein [Pseudomonadota bacterium]